MNNTYILYMLQLWNLIGSLWYYESKGNKLTIVAKLFACRIRLFLAEVIKTEVPSRGKNNKMKWINKLVNVLLLKIICIFGVAMHFKLYRIY